MPQINDIFNSGVICHAICIADRAGILDEIESRGFARLGDFANSAAVQCATNGLVHVLERARIVERGVDGTIRAGEQFEDCVRRKGLFTWFFAASSSVLLSAHNKIGRSSEPFVSIRDDTLIGSSIADVGRRNIDTVLRSVLDWGQYSCVLDIGCGDASRVQRIANEFGIEGVGLDASSTTIASADQRMRGTEEKRVRLVVGDALDMDFDPLLRAQIDVAMMALMAHDLLPEARAIAALRTWKVQLPNLKRLVICETVKRSDTESISADPEVPEVGYEFLHALLGIQIESDATWRDILRRAGYALLKSHVVPVPGNTHIYVCDAE